jgi:predicted O-methyltransferase YrrM
MNKHEVLSRLKLDKPLFHYLPPEDLGAYDEAVRRGELAAVAPGDFSMAVSPEVLSWIADRVTGGMTTLETGSGYTTVLFAALAGHHYSCTASDREAGKIADYLKQMGISKDQVTFVLGSTDRTLPTLKLDSKVDFAYVDGCHGYPFPALDWHYIDKLLKVGGVIGMDNAELRPVREHCEFLHENGAYELVAEVWEGYFVRFYRKLMDQDREWIDQPYSRAKKDPCDWRFATRFRRKVSKWVKPYLY